MKSLFARPTLVAAILLAAAAPSAAAPAAEPGTAGQVLAVRREAVVIRDAQNLAAKAEMPLLLKDAVATGSQSRVKLFFRDDSVLNLGERSRIQVREYLFSPEKNRSRSIYQLIDGSLKVVVGRSDLEIHTQTAVAAARGTTFLLYSDERARSCLMVLEGVVLLRNRDEKIPGEQNVEAGRMSCVPMAEPPSRSAAIDDKQLKKIVAATRVLGGSEHTPGALPGQPAGGSNPVFTPGSIDLGVVQPPPPQQPPPTPATTTTTPTATAARTPAAARTTAAAATTPAAAATAATAIRAAP